MHNIPVALCFFNRPDCTKRVFQIVKQWKPNKIYLVSDGPRIGRNENDTINSLRLYLENEIKWKCNIVRLYSDTNMGCSKKISSSLNYIFNHEKHCLILEDDCLPSNTFYSFCQNSLKFTNKEITSISGTYLGRAKNDSCGLCLYHLIWGWLGTSYAWENYSWDLKAIDIERIKKLEKLYGKNIIDYDIWFKMYDTIIKNPDYTWDYQFHICNLVNEKKSIFPYRNLIKNIGFDERATHTTSKDHQFSNIKLDNIDSSKIVINNHPDLNYTKLVQTDFFSNKTTIRNIKHKVFFKFNKFLKKL